MPLIKLHRDNASEPEVFEASMTEFYKEHLNLLRQGYRIYDNHNVCSPCDITADAAALLNAKSITVMRPAHGPQLVPLLIAVAISVVAAVILAPKIPNVTRPSVTGGDGEVNSARTEGLSARENKPLSGRIDDIWGRVSRHAPKLMSLPRRYFEDGIEKEEYELLLGRGKLEVREAYENETPYERIKGASMGVWYLSDYSSVFTPKTQDAIYTVGESVEVPFKVITNPSAFQARELNPSDQIKERDESGWSFVASSPAPDGSGSQVLTGNYTGAEDLTAEFGVGDLVDFQIALLGAYSSQHFAEYKIFPTESGQSTVINTSRIMTIEERLTITAVTPNSITVDLTGHPKIEGVRKTLNDHYNGQSLNPTKSINRIYSRNNTGKGVHYASLLPPVTNSAYEWYIPDHTGVFRPGNNNYKIAVNSASSMVYSIGGGASGIAGPYDIPLNTLEVQWNVVSRDGVFKSRKSDGARSDWTIDCEWFIWITNERGQRAKLWKSGVTGLNTSNITADASVGVTDTVDLTVPENGLTAKQAAEAEGLDYGLAFEIRRITDSADNSTYFFTGRTTLQDVYLLKNYYEGGASPDAPVFEDVTIAKCRVENNFSLREAKRYLTNFDVTRCIPIYDSVTNTMGTELVADASVDKVTIAMALDKFIGRKTLTDIDARTMVDVAEQIKAYYSGDHTMIEVGFRFDDMKIRFEQCFALLWQAVHCEVYTQGTYKVYPVLRRDNSSKQFTHRYKIKGTEYREQEFGSNYTGVEVTYRDDKTGKLRTLYETYDIPRVLPPANPLRINLDGVIHHRQAWVRMMRELNILEYQHTTVRFEADGIARLTVPGERVDVPDATLVPDRPGKDQEIEHHYRVYDGEVTKVDGLNVTLSQPVHMANGNPHSIRFSNNKGELGGAISVVAVDATGYVVTLGSAPSFDLYTGYNKRKTSFTFAEDSTRASMAVMVRKLTPNETKNGVKTRKITGINYDPRYFSSDFEYPGDN